MIHPTAIVHEKATLGEGVVVGPYAIVEEGVRIGDHTALSAHSIVCKDSIIGSHCRLDSFSVVGNHPNSTTFDRSVPSRVEIGDRCQIREHVTIHRSTEPNGSTVIGCDAFLMAGSHIAHDCVLGDRVILANQVMIAGHVSIGDDTFFGGGVGIHQFVRIGEGVMISGNASITKDIAPFLLVGERDELSGLNLIGLRRREVPAESIRELKRLYQTVLRQPGNPVKTAAGIDLPAFAECKRFLSFFIPNKRGYAKSVLS